MKALKELLFKMADDSLVIGHRTSEWTGLAPLYEEDLAFSSIAQDKLGHANTLYDMLHDLGEANADTLGFLRKPEEFRNCQFVELPIKEYDFSLIRHFLFDHAEFIRYTMLQNSTHEPLAKFAKKVIGEVRYHIMHANAWIKKLGNAATPEGLERMQNELNYAFPYALGIFEHSPFEQEIIEKGYFKGEEALKEAWLKEIKTVLSETKLTLPEHVEPKFGGRNFKHTEHFAPMMAEMTETILLDPNAEW